MRRHGSRTAVFRMMVWGPFLVATIVLGATSARADWLSYSGAENAPNIAEIRIGEDGVHIQLEVFVGDLRTFERLVPDDWLEGLAVDRPDAKERLRRFAAEDLRILADGTTPLPAELRVVEPRHRIKRYSPLAGKTHPLTGQTVSGPPEDLRVVYAELFYPFTERPSSLVFEPASEEGVPRAAIGFVAWHGAVPLLDFRYLPARCTLRLDWDDPWYSAFDHRNLRRWQRGPVQSFLYVEPLEVRHEILARVRNLEAWLDLDLKGRDFIEAEENEALKARVGAFFLEREDVTIDGARREPILDRVSFVMYSRTGSSFVDRPERLPLDTATVGVIITYLTNGLPQEVRSRWTLWSDRVRLVPTDNIDPAGGLPSEISPDDDVQVWTNYLRDYAPPRVVSLGVDPERLSLAIPLASIFCLLLALVLLILGARKGLRSAAGRGRILTALVLGIGAVLLRNALPVPVPRPGAFTPRLEAAEARTVLDDLLRNMYRALDFRSEKDVYDRLARSVDDDLLEDLYLLHRRALVVARAGGARARIQEVELREAEVTHLDAPRLAMQFHAKWTAAGSVNHWGHVHRRTNQYEARVTVSPIDGVWKITDLEVLDEKRL